MDPSYGPVPNSARIIRWYASSPVRIYLNLPRKESLPRRAKLIRYHRLTFDSIADGALRSTYLPWIESITHVKAGEEEELEVRLNSNEKVWRMLKQRLEEPSVRLKSQYSSRLYQWAKQYVAVVIQTSKLSYFAENSGFGSH